MKSNTALFKRGTHTDYLGQALTDQYRKQMTLIPFTIAFNCIYLDSPYPVLLMQSKWNNRKPIEIHFLKTISRNV